MPGPAFDSPSLQEEEGRYLNTDVSDLDVTVCAHDGPPVLVAEADWALHPDAPAFDSVHLFANHSSGVSVAKLELDGEIDQVCVSVRCMDQGWGYTGSAGAVVALYDETEQHVIAYSASALTAHGATTLHWSITPAENNGRAGDESEKPDGAHWPAKEFEKTMRNVCAQARAGMVLHLKVFTPNWGGWRVSCSQASLKARRAEDKQGKMMAFMGVMHARMGRASTAALIATDEAGHDILRSVLWPIYLHGKVA
jgi:hypothetical protein